MRIKRRAHGDLAVLLKITPKQLPAATHAQVIEVLDGLANILNDIQLHYANATTMYRNAPITGGALELLYVVRTGFRREDIRQQRLQNGEAYRPEDWDDDLPAL